MPVSIELTQPVNLAVTIMDQSVTVGNTHLTHAAVAVLVLHTLSDRSTALFTQGA